jgi:glycosyltransferase involved in cell wall biosynthesis
MAERRIKVLFMIGTLEVGGAEGQLLQLASRLDGERFEPVVYCFDAAGPFLQPVRGAGVRVESLGFRGFGSWRGVAAVWTGARAVRELVRFSGIIRREAPDIFHGLLFWAYIYGGVAAWMARVPVILSSRRSLSHFKRDNWRLRALERVVNRWTTLVVANSEAVRRDTLTHEGLPPSKVVVIHNGVEPIDARSDSGSELRAALALPAQAPVAAVVANLLPYKGHVHFVDAWRRVVDEIPDAIALLAGSGPLEADLRARVATAGLSRHVRLLGRWDDVPGLLRGADLLVHPSLEEGFSNAILEAMSAGRAVVATDVGGTAEAVVQGETGWLVPPADAARLGEAIVDLLRDDRRRRRFGDAGRARVLERFSVSGMVERYAALYESLASGGGPATDAL